jgi:hypothetical protein
MSNLETFTNNTLIIEVSEDDRTIKINWKGKSTDRDPSAFISPILSKALDSSTQYKKEMIIDFTELEYMNSSTITPISKIIEKGKNGTNKITINYQKDRKWQELSFSALKIFNTSDGRINFIGK